MILWPRFLEARGSQTWYCQQYFYFLHLARQKTKADFPVQFNRVTNVEEVKSHPYLRQAVSIAEEIMHLQGYELCGPVSATSMSQYSNTHTSNQKRFSIRAPRLNVPPQTGGYMRGDSQERQHVFVHQTPFDKRDMIHTMRSICDINTKILLLNIISWSTAVTREIDDAVLPSALRHHCNRYYIRSQTVYNTEQY